MSRKWTLLLAAAAALQLVWAASLPLTPGTGPPPETAASCPEPAVTHPPGEDGASPAPESETSDAAPGVRLKNDTPLRVDAEALASEPLTQRLAAEGPQILILHTHGTEAYTPVPGEEYEPTDPYRTADAGRSVIRVGEVLAEALRRQGLRVEHDTGLYDYPRYTGAYERSEAAARAWLARWPDIAVIIDLHRDAPGGNAPPSKELCADGAAQVMLLVGTGLNGLEHPHWRENLKLALALQRAMDEFCPGLAKPVELCRERYNQHLTAGSLILEVGTNGNTLSEAERAAELFAGAAGPVFLSLAD